MSHNQQDVANCGQIAADKDTHAATEGGLLKFTNALSNNSEEAPFSHNTILQTKRRQRTECTICETTTMLTSNSCDIFSTVAFTVAPLQCVTVIITRL